MPLQRIAVNVSIKQFTHPNFLEMVSECTYRNHFGTPTLEIEITESLLVQDTQEISVILQNLKEMKINIAIDDFGIGYSSLSRLEEMPIDT